MPTYGRFCPIAKAATVLSERWTLVILREMMCGSTRFNDLERGLPGISRALLSRRLRTLVDCGIVSTEGGDGIAPGYFLTQRGLELQPLVVGIGEWGQRWLNAGTEPEEIDTDLLVWDIHRRIELANFPARRVVVEIDFSGLSEKAYWLVVENEATSVCLDPPGFENDLVVESDTLTLHNVWMGRADLNRALKQDAIRIFGPSNLINVFVRSLQYSLFAQIPYNGGPPTGSTVM